MKGADTLRALRAAAWWVRREMRRREVPGEHPSHLAATLLREAEQRYELETCGVEGWTCRARRYGSAGVSYLNAGDPYVPTLYVWSDSSSSWRVGVTAWEWLARHYPADRD